MPNPCTAARIIKSQFDGEAFVHPVTRMFDGVLTPTGRKSSNKSPVFERVAGVIPAVSSDDARYQIVSELIGCVD
jgi:hypothetical protein